MSALVVTIHALLLARAEIQRDRDSLFESTVNQSTGVVDDEGDASAIAGYDHTLASIAEALEAAKRDPVPLRDYFAAKALAECIRVAADQTPPGGNADLRLSTLFSKASTYAYVLADSMLKARES